MTEPSYYDILGIRQDANENEIKKAYKKLAVKWHPDKNLDNKEIAEKKFAEISNAYHVLSDPEKRKMYDTYGKNFDQEGTRINPEDIFREFFSTRRNKPSGFTFVNTSSDVNDIFGNGFPFGNSFHGFDDFNSNFNNFNKFGSKSFNFAKHKNNDSYMNSEKLAPTEKELECTLKELYNGRIKKLKIKRNNRHTHQILEEIIHVEIKPGYKEGTKITFDNKGDIDDYGTSADLIFILKEVPHNQFQRVGNDLKYTAEITLSEALSGTTISFTNLNDKIIKTKISPLEHSKTVHIIKNAGFPIRQKGQVSGNGDLLIDFKIKLRK